MAKVSKGQFGWISEIRDKIKYAFSKPTTKSIGKRQYNQKLDSNGRLLVNNNYVVYDDNYCIEYKFYEVLLLTVLQYIQTH